MVAIDKPLNPKPWGERRSFVRLFDVEKMTLAVSLSFTDTSLVLLTIIIGLSLYSKYFSGYTPLVHPLLLQKQSDVSQTRKQGESAIYRNWATGHGTPVSRVL